MAIAANGAGGGGDALCNPWASRLERTQAKLAAGSACGIYEMETGSGFARLHFEIPDTHR